MIKQLQLFVLFAISSSIKTLAQNISAQRPILPIPQPKQVECQKMETYAFMHFKLKPF